MRKLAKALGFEVMSLYNHITNKQDLLSLMLDRVASQIHNSEPDVAPLGAIRQQALSVRSQLIKHPWAASIWQQHMPGPARIEQMETMLLLLSRSGLDPDLAHHGFHAVNNHILGYTLQEQDTPFASLEPVEAQAQIDSFLSELSPANQPHTIAHVNQHLHGETESSFELVLDLILNGLVQLNTERRACNPSSKPSNT